LGGRAALAFSALWMSAAGCASDAANRPAAAGAPPAIALQSSQTAQASARDGTAARATQQRPRRSTLGLAESMEAASAPRPPPLPCELRVSHSGAGIALDFHAETASAARVREQVRELETFLNEFRGDQEASGAPGGRPSPGHCRDCVGPG
jgi:hypothetical protein